MKKENNMFTGNKRVGNYNDNSITSGCLAKPSDIRDNAAFVKKIIKEKRKKERGNGSN